MNTNLEFLEAFALGEDRAKSLDKLLPGTEEHFFFKILHLQNVCGENPSQELLELLETAMKSPEGRHSQRIKDLDIRQKLLRYNSQPETHEDSLRFLKERLYVNLDHPAPVVASAKQDSKMDDDSSDDSMDDDLPELEEAAPPPDSVLEDKVIKTEDIAAQEFKENGFRNFSALAHDWLASQELDQNQRRELLRGLTAPPPNIVDLVCQSLSDPNFKFSAPTFSVAQQLTLEQLNEIKERPAAENIMNRADFVHLYISKLAPSSDVDLENDLGAKTEYYERLHSFVKTLGAIHRSIKVLVLNHLLELQSKQGIYNIDIFLEYLQIERQQTPYNYHLWLAMPQQQRRELADFGVSIGRGKAALGMIRDDTELVQHFLAKFFQSGESVDKFSAHCDELWLQRYRAEVMLLAGDMDNAESYYSTIGSMDAIDGLRERIDIEFASSNPKVYSVADDVTLKVFVKNVPSLLVKVFKVNTTAYYRKHLSEISTDINLDGITAEVETTHEYKEESAFHRVERELSFPSLSNKKGVFIIELIGNGVHSRAVIRKGNIKYLERQSVAGHVFTLLDDENEVIKNGSIWMSGQLFEPNADNDRGEIYVDFSSSLTRSETILVTDQDGFTVLDHFQHQSENYSMKVGFHCDRESLLEKNRASVIVRPTLYLNDVQVPVKVLEDVSLTIKTVDRNAIDISKTIDDFKIQSSEESIHSFTVPSDLRQIDFTLNARVKLASQQKFVPLRQSKSINLNSIDTTTRTSDVFISRTLQKGYVISVLGKTGEPRVGRNVQVNFEHCWFSGMQRNRNRLYSSLKTDSKGRVYLGKLDNIRRVAVVADGCQQTVFNMCEDTKFASELIHAKQGDTISIPYMDKRKEILKQTRLALFDSNHVKDYSSEIKVEDGSVLINGLQTGDYVLQCKDAQQEIEIKVVDGKDVANYVAAKNRILQVKKNKPLQIIDIGVSEDSYSLYLANHSPNTRVHIVASHFVHDESNLFQSLSDVTVLRPSSIQLSPSTSRYLKQRTISEEYRYVLERKNAKKNVGNMLQRPSMLLNPWSYKSTDTSVQEAKGGEALQHSAMDGRAQRSRAMKAAASRHAAPSSSGYHSLEFLSAGSTVLYNLKPDRDGYVGIPKSAFSKYHLTMSVLALDTEDAVFRSVALKDHDSKALIKKNLNRRDLQYQDIRLFPGLDPEKHFTQKRGITLLREGESKLIEDYKTTDIETYDTVSDAFSLYKTLSGKTKPNECEKLTEFDFLTKWASLDDETKLIKYDKYSSHELNFFLYHKDTDFFDRVIRPYIADKTQKTLIDVYLLNDEEQLKSFLDPYAFSQLNTLERILLASKVRGGLLDETVRFFKDKTETLPVDAKKQDELFRSALQRKSLESDPTPRGGGGDGGPRGGGGSRYADTRKESEHIRSRMEYEERRKQELEEESHYSRHAEEMGLRRHEEEMEISRLKEEMRREEMHMEEEVRERHKVQKKMSLRRPRGLTKHKRQSRRSAKLVLEKQAAPEAFGSYDMAQRERAAARPLYQALDKTKEYEETQYYKVKFAEQTAYLIEINRFWGDYAAHLLCSDEKEQGPFLSENLAEATKNSTEMLMALAVLSLPFESDGPEIIRSGSQMLIKASTPVVIFTQQIQESSQLPSSVLVSQNYFDPDESTQYVDGEQVDKFVTDEFLHSKVYGCRVTLTNVSSVLQKVQVMKEIPQGAVPVNNSFRNKTEFVTVGAYRTEIREFHFYFPFEGSYRHYPVHVSKNFQYIGHGPVKQLQVVSSHTKVDLDSWRYVSQEGSNADVIEFLKTHNIHRIGVTDIAWRLKDKQFFLDVTAMLRHNIFDDVIWGYSLLHNTPNELSEFLAQKSQITNHLGRHFESALVVYDHYIRKNLQHLEYAPLVNARAHQLGKERKILNSKLEQQIRSFLEYLCYVGKEGRNSLQGRDLMDAVYYFLLQDRIDSAIEIFNSIKEEDVSTHRVQYDYLRAYLDFFTNSDEGPVIARSVAAKYRNYNVLKKRKLFTDIEQHLSEIDYKLEEVDHPEVKDVYRDIGDRDRRMQDVAAAEPSYDLDVDGQQISLNYRNVDKVTVNFYLMDIELLFSTSPFMKEGGSSFSMVSPNESLQVDLSENAQGSNVENVVKIDIPEALRTSNIFIEILGKGLSRTKTHYSNQLNVQITEPYGHLKVTNKESKRPVSRVYVKVYSKLNDGSTKFYKDGYTDLRGRFDYASISTDQLQKTSDFAVLIMSEEFGAVVREVKPPAP